MMWYLILIFCGAFCAHWMVDFCLQPRKIAESKSHNIMALISHCLSYTFIMTVSVALLTSNTKDMPYLAAAFFVSHFVIDFVTSKLTSVFWTTQDMHKFFTVIGFDQFLHTSVIFIVVLMSMSSEYDRRDHREFYNIQQRINNEREYSPVRSGWDSLRL